MLNLSQSPNRPVFVGLSGRMGSGKTTLAKHLSEKYGMQYVRYSQVISEWLGPIPGEGRDSLQKKGFEVMSDGRQLELNNRILERIDATRSAIIDGLRHPLDFATLTSSLGESFHLIFIKCDSKIRFSRLTDLDFQSFLAMDAHPVEQHIDQLERSASAIIIDNGNPGEVLSLASEALTRFERMHSA